MNAVSVDILLEFLYNQFAVTFIFCLVGSWIREATRSVTSKDKESKMLSIKRIVTSTMFSTFLMCACAEYIDLPFSVYAIVSVFIGMWGLVIINVTMSGKFISKFSTNFAKKLTGPLLKSAVESASEILKEEQNKDDQKEKETKDS